MDTQWIDGGLQEKSDQNMTDVNNREVLLIHGGSANTKDTQIKWLVQFEYRKWSPKWTANDSHCQPQNDPKRKIRLAWTQITGTSSQVYYHILLHK